VWLPIANIMLTLLCGAFCQQLWATNKLQCLHAGGSLYHHCDQWQCGWGADTISVASSVLTISIEAYLLSDNTVSAEVCAGYAEQEYCCNSLFSSWGNWNSSVCSIPAGFWQCKLAWYEPALLLLDTTEAAEVLFMPGWYHVLHACFHDPQSHDLWRFVCKGGISAIDLAGAAAATVQVVLMSQDGFTEWACMSGNSCTTAHVFLGRLVGGAAQHLQCRYLLMDWMCFCWQAASRAIANAFVKAAQDQMNVTLATRAEDFQNPLSLAFAAAQAPMITAGEASAFDHHYVQVLIFVCWSCKPNPCMRCAVLRCMLIIMVMLIHSLQLPVSSRWQQHHDHQ
jgi:hypothetical protein